MPGPPSPLPDDAATLVLVKRQAPLDCVLYRYGSFSLALDIVRESCLHCPGAGGGRRVLLRVAQWKHSLEGNTHQDKENTQIPGASHEGRGTGLGRQPRAFPSTGLGGGKAKV